MSESNVNTKRFKSFVSISLRNESINLHKKRVRLNDREVSCDETVLFDKGYCDDYSFLENQIRFVNYNIVIKNDLLYEVLSSWHQTYRDIIYLSICEGWSDAKIGTKLNLPRSTVQRWKIKLKNELKGKLMGGKNETMQ